MMIGGTKSEGCQNFWYLIQSYQFSVDDTNFKVMQGGVTEQLAVSRATKPAKSSVLPPKGALFPQVNQKSFILQIQNGIR